MTCEKATPCSLHDHWSVTQQWCCDHWLPIPCGAKPGFSYYLGEELKIRFSPSYNLWESRVSCWLHAEDAVAWNNTRSTLRKEQTEKNYSRDSKRAGCMERRAFCIGYLWWLCHLRTCVTMGRFLHFSESVLYQLYNHIGHSMST